jgi:hypothetical protein
MKVIKTWIAVVGLLLAFLVVAPAPAQAAAAPYCGITWGSLAKSAGALSGGSVTNVRAGRHACFDRMVIDVRGHANGYRVQYVQQVKGPGSGQPVALRGGAFLEVVVLAAAYDRNTGSATYTPANRKELVNTAGYATFRQLAYTASFEGYTHFGVGVRARLPFHVFVLDGPGNTSRIVLDVAHKW